MEALITILGFGAALSGLAFGGYVGYAMIRASLRYDPIEVDEPDAIAIKRHGYTAIYYSHPSETCHPEVDP